MLEAAECLSDEPGVPKYGKGVRCRQDIALAEVQCRPDFLSNKRSYR